MALTKELAPDEKFDVLIVDEASQLRLSHALALCGHISQIIVAGIVGNCNRVMRIRAI